MTALNLNRIIFILVLSFTWSYSYAQEVDFSGEWRPLFHEDEPERAPGPHFGDFSGLPINDEARMRGESYQPNRISTVIEYQCRPHGGDYAMRGLSFMRIQRRKNRYSGTSC